MVYRVASIILKILEFIALQGATITVAYYMKHLDEFHKISEKAGFDKLDVEDPYEFGAFGRHEFFLYSSAGGLIIVIAVFAILLTKLRKRAGVQYMMLTIHVIWALQLLVSSALLTSTLHALNIPKENLGYRTECDVQGENSKYKCAQLIAGVVCGFLAMLLFTMDSVIYFLSIMSVNYQQ